MPPFFLSPWITLMCLLQEAFPEHPAQNNLLLHLDQRPLSVCAIRWCFSHTPKKLWLSLRLYMVFLPWRHSSCMEVATPHFSLWAAQSPALAFHMVGAHEIPTDFKGDYWSLSCSRMQFQLCLTYVPALREGSVPAPQCERVGTWGRLHTCSQSFFRADACSKPSNHGWQGGA